MGTYEAPQICELDVQNPELSPAIQSAVEELANLACKTSVGENDTEQEQ